ncbi:ribosome maturation factor RimM [Hansschlegelia sp. KR7-227]|uniref:ribosome maturation factor RimM n=1 Tax=Hansschlegelia sp. KR7-227 TaxID=3400914 RepID=UPI003C0DBCD2
MPSPLVQIGVIGAAHGVKGEVRAKAFTQDPAALGRYAPLSDATGQRLFKVASLRPLKGDMVVLRLAGVDTREAAEALNGVGLFAPRAALPAPADEDEFYHADLIGLRAETEDGSAVGEIVAVQNFGADDLLEIRLAGARRTVLLPFTAAVVPTVDVAGGRVVIAPPEGALEEPSEAEPDAD